MAVASAPEKNHTPADGVVVDTPQRGLLGLLARKGFSSRTLHILNWLTVAACVYVLITAVNVIGSGFELAAGSQAEELFNFAANPVVGLMIGVVATALTQSSSTTTSVTVGLVAGGLPLSIAVPIIMGANLGTTLTNTLVSLGMVRDKSQFRRGFAAATVHDFFNLLAVVIFLPLEMAFGVLERLGAATAGVLSGTDGGFLPAIFGGMGTAVSYATEPLADLIEGSFGWLPDVWAGVAMIVVAVALIMAVINLIGRKLKALLVGRAQRVLNSAIGRGPVTSIGSGALITVMVQSSSTTTALMVPLAGSGKLTLRQIYPFTLGANIGTTITALVAAFAFEGEMGTIALTAALIHLFFNLLGTLVIYGIPGIREIPLRGAEWLANLAVNRTVAAFVWVLAIFIGLPLALIFLL